MSDNKNNKNNESVDAVENENKNNEPYLLELDKLNCIGCGACVAVAPDHWELTDEGKVSISGGVKRVDSWEEKPISKQDLQENTEAAESCPVGVIHITSNKDGKRLI
ncbi:MAG: ferredoxin [Candidatus Woesearchaeota archaeon]